MRGERYTFTSLPAGEGEEEELLVDIGQLGNPPGYTGLDLRCGEVCRILIRLGENCTRNGSLGSSTVGAHANSKLGQLEILSQ